MPEGPSTPRGEATRRRILDAAREEFSASGIAGARIDRIMRAAATNKAQLYGYFGSKDGLFDAVVLDTADRMTDGAPFTDDLAEWAVRIYDECLVNPEMVRLSAWLRLERGSSGTLAEGHDRAEGKRKLDAIRRGQEQGRIRPGDPYSLLVLVLAMASAWSPVSPAWAAGLDEDPAEHDRRKTLLRESVARVIAP